MAYYEGEIGGLGGGYNNGFGNGWRFLFGGIVASGVLSCTAAGQQNTEQYGEEWEKFVDRFHKASDSGL